MLPEPLRRIITKALANPTLWLSITICVLALARLDPVGWSGLYNIVSLLLRTVGRHPDFPPPET